MVLNFALKNSLKFPTRFKNGKDTLLDVLLTNRQSSLQKSLSESSKVPILEISITFVGVL